MESHWNRELRCLLILPGLLKAFCLCWTNRLALTDHTTNFPGVSEAHVHLPLKVISTWKIFTHCKQTIFKSLFFVMADPHAVFDEHEGNAGPYVACWGCTIFCWCSQKVQDCS